MNFDFLNLNTSGESAVELGEGGSLGLIAPWSIATIWRMWAEDDLDLYEEDDVTYSSRRQTDAGYFYYFTDYEAGVKAAKVIGQQYPPRQVWRWESNLEDVANMTAEGKASWTSSIVSKEVNVVGLGSKARHELNMIFLPSVVQSVALAAGLLEEPIYDYASISGPASETDMQVVEAHQFRLVGEVTGKSYESSELWQARTELWAALGEDNPKATNLPPATRLVVKSEKLAACLALLHFPQKGIWADVIDVPDPVIASNGERYSVPVCREIFRSEEDALAVADSGGTESESAPATTVSGKAVPAAWSENVEDWLDYVASVIGEYEGKPKPVIVKALKKRDAELQEQYAATAEDFIEWMDELATA